MIFIQGKNNIEIFTTKGVAKEVML